MVLGETMSAGALVEFDVPASGASSRPSESPDGAWRTAALNTPSMARPAPVAAMTVAAAVGWSMASAKAIGGRPQQGAQRGRDGPLSGLRHHARGLPAPRGFTWWRISEFPSVDGRLDARRCWSTAVGAAGQATRADSLGGSVPAVSG